VTDNQASHGERWPGSPARRLGRARGACLVIRTPDRRVRVFISSTMAELAAERRAVTDAITQLRLTPVLFEIGARPYPPRELYRAYLQQSDVFLGIYGGSYGWVGPGMDVSGLEDEYRLSTGKPRLIYVKHVPQREPRLNSLLETIRAEGVVSYRAFDTADELGSLVADDLALLLTERFAGPAAAPPVAPVPVPRRPLVNRAGELRALTEQLPRADVGLVTLTGPGGVGKTHLALAAANAVAGQFADGAAFVSLEGLTDRTLIRRTVAQELHVPTVPGQTLDDSLLAFFRPRQMLLVLDNVEQVVSEAPLAERALEMAPGLKVLVTSREALRIRGERVVPVAPLALPNPGAALDPAQLATVPAVAMFISAARETRPDFSLTETNAAAVVEICRRLDGLPLALQLAAARLTVLPPAALLERLDRRLPLLTRGPRDMPARHQTLRAAIASSYDLLPPDEQRVFRHLGVFVGGFTLEAVEAVAGGGPSDLDPLDAISSLVGKSLVFLEPLDEATPRYGMLETIREFALEQLAASGERGEIRRRHAEFLRDLAERVEPLLLVPAQRARWMHGLEHVQDNFRAALEWSLGDDGVLDVGIALAGALGYFWLMSGRLEEGHWFDDLLARRPAGGDSLAWAKVLHGGALALWGRGDLAHAEAREESAVAIFRSAGDSRWLAYGLALLGRVRTGQQRPAEARLLLEEALRVFRGAAATYGQDFDAYLRYYLGLNALSQGDSETARTELEASLTGLEAAGDDMACAVVLGMLGLDSAQRGDHADARERFARALPVLRRGGDAWDLALLLLNAGLEEARAASPSAGSLLVEALGAWQHIGRDAGVALALAGLGEVAASAGAAHRAGQLLGAGQALLPADDPLLRVTVPYDLPSRLASAQAGVDAAAFDLGLAEGRQLTLDQAVATGLTGEENEG